MTGNFSLLVKPACYCCNLHCSYCFYLKKSDLFGQGDLRMDDNVLSTMIRKFMSLEMPVSSFGWQGGEPTLMGLDFYRRAVEFQRQFAKPGQCVANALQTNGTLLDDDWGTFLHANRFLVGISIDGPEDVHNQSRVWTDGRGSHADVMRGVDILKRHNVEFNVLTLVSAANQDRPLEVYDYLKKLGVMYHQYIECVEFDRAGRLTPFSVDPRKWGHFLCAGCCPKNRPGGKPETASALCEGWKIFYSHTLRRFKELATRIAKERQALANQPMAGTPPPTRNAPCPCGSGRKHKKCCGV